METKKATLTYLLRDNKVLMIKGVKTYAPHYQKYNGLGGKFESEDNDNPEACAIREIAEESGYKAQNLEYVGKILFSGMFPDKQFLVYYYTCKDFSGEQREDPEQGPLVWAELDETNLPNVPTLDGDKIFIPWILAGRKFDATFYYNDREYIKHEVTFNEQSEHNLTGVKNL